MADDSVTIITYIEVVPDEAGRVHDLAAAWRHAVRGEPRAVDVAALQCLGRPGHFVLVETWTGAPARGAYARDALARDFRSALERARLAPDDERVHHGLSSGPAAVPSRAPARSVPSPMSTSFRRARTTARCWSPAWRWRAGRRRAICASTPSPRPRGRTT